MKESTLKIILMLSIFLVIMAGIAVTVNEKKENKNSNTNTNVQKDSLRFKEEYEAYNNKEREDDRGNYFQELSIPKENPIKYATAKEVANVIENGTGVIYFGYPTCPWCRNAVPVLIEAAQKKSLDTIYYLNVNEYKNMFAVKDGKVIKIKDEKEGYYDLLKVLDKELDPFIITSNGKNYEVGEKRIYVPFIVFVQKGKIVSTHQGTVTLNNGQTKYDALTEEQHKELLDTYISAMNKIVSEDYCDEACE